MKQKHALFITWSALLLSVLAFVFSILAYMRGSTVMSSDTQQNIISQTEQKEREEEIKRQIDIDNAQTSARLALIRAEYLADRNYEKAAEAVRQLRSEMAQRVDSIEGINGDDLRVNDEDLQNLETNLRQNSAEALNAFQNILSRLEEKLKG